MTSTAVINAEIESINAYLQAAQEILRDGFMPDITALEKRVANLCQSIKNAPKDVQQECLSGFSALLERLDQCEKDMRAFNETRLKTGTHGKP